MVRKDPDLIYVFPDALIKGCHDLNGRDSPHTLHFTKESVEQDFDSH